MPKYVVTSSERGLDWSGSHSIGSDVATAVTDLEERTDGSLVVLTYRRAGATARSLP
ncbi:hypothetical protein [Serinibacter arcticus]|uniref:hypothetical protein n=1 Tax=Serinibacter arcticus TaxID=1655435 RepID=UPI0013049783|nr:hypothetical protein [Serinibacter arcticus]